MVSHRSKLKQIFLLISAICSDHIQDVYTTKIAYFMEVKDHVDTL